MGTPYMYHIKIKTVHNKCVGETFAVFQSANEPVNNYYQRVWTFKPKIKYVKYAHFSHN